MLERSATAGAATVSGLAPHVLHHAGLLAGVALVSGALGTVLFGVIGLVVSVPFLLRLRRRFNSWVAPGIALVIFAGMFSISAFVIGPAISGTNAPSQTPAQHQSHHSG